MSSYNKVTLVGVLKYDVVLSKDKKGVKSTFTICVERHQRDQSVSMDYFDVVCFDKLAEVSGLHLCKGKKVLVDGHIQIRTHIKDGERHWITEIVADYLKFLSVPIAA
jgi:single-strand DNA-binding protein